MFEGMMVGRSDGKGGWGEGVDIYCQQRYLMKGRKKKRHKSLRGEGCESCAWDV